MSDHLLELDRFGRITASVAAAILRVEGCTQSRKWAWRVITGREPEKVDVWHDIQRGLDHEEDAIFAAELELGALARPGRFVAHPNLSWLGASPDAFILERGLEIPIEAKCPRTLHAELPPLYVPQVQIQMECCNVPYMYFVSWTDECQKVMKVERDELWWTTNKPLLEEFNESYIVPDVEPPKSPRRTKPKKEKEDAATETV